MHDESSVKPDDTSLSPLPQILRMRVNERLNESRMERGHQMKSVTRACALSATAAATTVLLAGGAAAQDGVLEKKRAPVPVEQVVGARQHPARVLVNFTHEMATQWVLGVGAPAASEQFSDED